MAQSTQGSKKACIIQYRYTSVHLVEEDRNFFLRLWREVCKNELKNVPKIVYL